MGKYWVEKKDLAFWLLEMHKTHGFKQLSKEDADDLKRSIRSYTNAPVSDKRYLVGSGDYFDEYFLYLVPLPADIQTKDDAIDYFFSRYYRSYEPEPYDCTGQLSTAWCKIFRKPNGRFWAYHAMHRDI